MPDPEVARALVRHWSVIQIGATTPPALAKWQIVSREFRENLQWAIVTPGEKSVSAAVRGLLDELAARGITVHELPC
jgi:hypothetical protein